MKRIFFVCNPWSLLSVLGILFSSQIAHSTDVSIGNPVVEATPSHYISRSNKDVVLCERVKIIGRSRLELERYFYSLNVVLVPNSVISEKHHNKIQVCFHGNSSLEMCNCEFDQWEGIQKGAWSSKMSPYQEKYVDFKFIGEIPGSISISVEEVSQPWRLVCLCVGFTFMLLAPVFSSWVPFYYSTSMAIGVFLVVLILLFQGMKLLPTGKKSFLYLSVYSSVVGIGTFILHYVSSVVNSILVNFGLGEELHHPVYVFVGACIVLTGAALGYWLVRKFIISKDGSVDAGVAQFVKWAMRIIGSTFILQSTLDPPLMLAALIVASGVCLLVEKLGSSMSSGCRLQRAPKNNRAEFLSKPHKFGSRMGCWSTNNRSPAWSNSPVKGLVSSSCWSWSTDKEDHFSTFHKVTKRRKYTPRQWEDFTRESTQQAVSEWAASPEVASWLVRNSERIHLSPPDCSSHESSESESNSAGNACRSGRVGFFGW